MINPNNWIKSLTEIKDCRTQFENLKSSLFVFHNFRLLVNTDLFFKLKTLELFLNLFFKCVMQNNYTFFHLELNFCFVFLNNYLFTYNVCVQESFLSNNDLFLITYLKLDIV